MCNTYVHVFIKTKILVKVLKKFIVVIQEHRIEPFIYFEQSFQFIKK